MSLIVIIGAGPGISYAVAEKFGKNGFKVAMISRSEEKLKKYKQEFESKNINLVYKIADSANEENLQKALSELENEEGFADLYLYNASGLSVKDLLEQDWETMKSMFDISVGGAFHLIKWALPKCLEKNTGKIFFTGGGTALQGSVKAASLSVGKAGLRNLVQAAQEKVKNTNIHIAHLLVNGYVEKGNDKYDPSKIAEQYWKLFNQNPGEFENEIIY